LGGVGGNENRWWWGLECRPEAAECGGSGGGSDGCWLLPLVGGDGWGVDAGFLADELPKGEHHADPCAGCGTIGLLVSDIQGWRGVWKCGRHT